MQSDTNHKRVNTKVLVSIVYLTLYVPQVKTWRASSELVQDCWTPIYPLEHARWDFWCYGQIHSGTNPLVDVTNLDEDELAFPILLRFKDNENCIFYSGGTLDISDISTSIQVILVK